MKVLFLLFAAAAAMIAACGASTPRQAGDADIQATSGNTVIQNQNAAVSRSDPAPGTHGLKDENMSESTIKALSMKASAKNTNAGLLIEYTIENHTDQNQYAWDLMIGYDGNTQKIDHNGAYIFFKEPKSLHVIRAELPLPAAFDVARKEIPFARLIPPGGQVKGTVKLPHPVTEFSPYFGPPVTEEQKRVVCSEVILMVGWTSVKPGMNISERTVGGEKVYAIRGAWAPPYQEILQEKFPVSVEVITYTGEFERQLPLK